MAVTLPNGILFSIGTTIDSEKTVTAISNANPGVASAATHGYTNNDLVWLKSGWQKITDRIIRVSGQTPSTFDLSGQDTTNTTLFPSGAGAGTVRKISGWTQISQVLECTTSGGEMQFANYSFLEQDFESQIPTQHSAQSLTLSIADDPALPGYAAIKKAAGQRVAVPFRAQMPDGSVILYVGHLSFNETPSMTKNQIMACQATFSLSALPVRYAA